MRTAISDAAYSESELKRSSSLPSSLEDIISAFETTRRLSETLCEGLETEDFAVQSMPDCSPTKWHLAHTSWFFENFILVPFLKGYRVFHPEFGLLFNSYYESVGKFYDRPKRGMITRPTVKEVFNYRAHVNEAMGALLHSGWSEVDGETQSQLRELTTLGIHHEQQHQELMLMDILHLFSLNPLKPAYFRNGIDFIGEARVPKWMEFPEGLYEVGNSGQGFSFDHEQPAHRVYLKAFRLSDRLVTNAEYLKFIEAGGYSRPEFWLSSGWTWLKDHQISAPLYWEKSRGKYLEFSLHGLKNWAASSPVSHISFYEADAYARFAGMRLPTEAEWEVAARSVSIQGNFLDYGSFKATPAQGDDPQFYGDLWQWTGSAFLPYPGFKPLAGSMGEYNGKFMSGQMVLRGGSFATPKHHIRASYRNFFAPHTRWHFSGIRLAQEI